MQRGALEAGRMWGTRCDVQDVSQCDTIVVLLVDSEGPVPASTSPIEHLKQRDPSWKLQHMDGDAVHLMV